MKKGKIFWVSFSRCQEDDIGHYHIVGFNEVILKRKKNEQGN